MFIIYEARTPQSLVVSGVRHASLSVSDTNKHPYYVLYFGQVSMYPCRVRCPYRCRCFIAHHDTFHRPPPWSIFQILLRWNRGRVELHDRFLWQLGGVWDGGKIFVTTSRSKCLLLMWLRFDAPMSFSEWTKIILMTTLFPRSLKAFRTP